MKVRQGQGFTVACAAVCALLLLLGASPSGAEPTGNAPPVGVSEAAWEDIQFNASQSSESVDVLVSRYLATERMIEVLDPIIDAHPDSYAVHGVTKEGGIYIHFRGSPPPQAMAAAQKDPKISVHGGATYSMREAEAWNAAIFPRLVEVLPNSSGAMSWVDPVTGRMEVIFSGDPGPSTQALMTVLKESQDAGRLAGPLPSVNITLDPDVSMEREAINGGDRLTRPGEAGTWCTAAFPAKYGSLRGVMSAKHCDPQLDADFVDNLYNASRRVGYSTGDAQWSQVKPGHTIGSHFRYAWGSYRPVWAHPNIAEGLDVCRFGAVSGNGDGCTGVWKTSTCVQYVDGTTCGMVATYRKNGSAVGDSGGPWYYGNNAYGIHAGGGKVGTQTVGSFTHSKKALSLLGLTAIYGPR